MRISIPLVSWSSAVVAALIGFGGTVPLIVEAMQVMQAPPDAIGSSVTALCIGIGLGGIALSLAFRMPIVLAWSTPGAALLAASTLGATWNQAVGAFLVAGLLMVVLGLVPALGRLMSRIPASVASAMQAGILLPFCLGLFRTGTADTILVLVLLLVFIVARQRFPLYALLLVLASALLLVLGRGELASLPPGDVFGSLVPTAPSFDLRVAISLGVPLFLVTLVSQNLPGLVVLRQSGYNPPPQTLLLATGLETALLAPFGAHGINLAAITAAICTGKDAHPDAARRWIVGVLYGGCYLLLAVFSAPLVRVFVALPHATIAALTGIALVAPLTASLNGMLEEPGERDAAVLTFAATASGLTLAGIGSAFWGLVVGFAALGIRAALRRRATP
jgi:benzoate membrane transport protein